MTVTFNVTTPGTAPAGATVYIAGALNRLDGGLGQTASHRTGPRPRRNQYAAAVSKKFLRVPIGC